MFEGLSFLEYLILILIGLLFFKENLISWVASKFGIKNGNGHSANGEKIPLWAQTLIQHFNHETTDKWEKFDEKLEKHHELEKETLNILREMKEYGIPCRDKQKS